MYNIPKFTCTERLTEQQKILLRIPDAEIIKSIYDETGKTTTVSNLTRLKQEIKRDSYLGTRLCVKVNMNPFMNSEDLQKRHCEIATVPIPIKTSISV